MDKLQLLILKKQYEILKLLEPGNRDHDLAWQAIDSGFELEIEQLTNEASVEPVSSLVCNEVRVNYPRFHGHRPKRQRVGVHTRKASCTPDMNAVAAGCKKPRCNRISFAEPRRRYGTCGGAHAQFSGYGRSSPSLRCHGNCPYGSCSVGYRIGLATPDSEPFCTGWIQPVVATLGC
jgi:hypothetical protein